MKWLCCSLIILVIGWILFIIQKPIIDLCDLNKCPFCYGTNLCDEFEKGNIHLNFNKLSYIFYNFLSVKNIYFANYSGIAVILKKLASTSELKNLDATRNFNENLSAALKSNQFPNFKICDNKTVELFLNIFYSINYTDQELSTILQINVEPLILQIFRAEENWPVPKYFGACGRIIVEENCGQMLNDFEMAPWNVRLYIAYQILSTAVKFTEEHLKFRMYLTDISPDNIVVDENLKVYFVDLENVILTQNVMDATRIHRSEHFDEMDGFAFSEDQICGSAISDHNIYSVCHLLLSKNAPWPMMTGGLLHTPPAKYTHIVEMIDACVDPKPQMNRFDIASMLIHSLKNNH